MRGMASGPKAISPFPPPPFGATSDPLDDEPENKSNPILTKIMPPTTRTMLSDTEKALMINAPKIKKKNKSSNA